MFRHAPICVIDLHVSVFQYCSSVNIISTTNSHRDNRRINSTVYMIYEQSQMWKYSCVLKQDVVVEEFYMLLLLCAVLTTNNHAIEVLFFGTKTLKKSQNVCEVSECFFFVEMCRFLYEVYCI